MTNPYYNPTGVPAHGAAVTSAVVRTEFTAIQAGFDKMPTLSGNGNKLVKVNAAGDAMTVSAGIVDAASSTVLTIDSAGLTYIGDTTPAGTLLGLMISTNTAAGNNLVLRKSASASNALNLAFMRSRGTAAAPTVLTSGDVCMAINAYGYDGSTYTIASSIITESIGTISAGVVPGAVTIRTANASGVLTENFRVTYDGTITLGGTSAAPALKVIPAGTPATANYLIISANNAGSSVAITAQGLSDANVNLAYQTSGTGGHYFTSAGGSVVQVAILATASADRYITMTGSNGGNPSISTNVGNLTLSSAGGATSYLQLSNAGTPVSVVSTAAISTVLSVSQTTNALTTTYPRLLDLYHDFSLGSAFGIAWRSAGRYDWIGQMQTSGRFAAVVNTSATPVPVWVADSSGNLSLGGDQGSEQVRILRATADRWITMTGSNGGNPTIGVSAGALGISATIQQATADAGDFAYFSSSYASSENAVRAHTTQATSGISIKLSNAGNNKQASMRLAGVGNIDFYLNQASDDISTAGNVALRLVTSAGSRHVTITADNTNPAIGVSGGSLAISSALVLSQTTLLATSVSLTNGAAAGAGTITNAPAAGNPTKWIPINDNGTTRYIPAW